MHFLRFRINPDQRRLFICYVDTRKKDIPYAIDKLYKIMNETTSSPVTLPIRSRIVLLIHADALDIYIRKKK